MRLDRPVGVLLLLWPTLAALWLAAGGTPPAPLIAVFTAGVLLMRSAGCVVNDLADRRFDGQVARTRNRPLATGAILPWQAFCLFAALCLLALMLLIWLNPLARWLAVPGLLIAVLYPFSKRWTQMPQGLLGVAFSWGIIMAFAAVTETLPAIAWLYFSASLLWIVAYDTLYAMVDRADDLKAGVKSAAILFGRADRLAVGILQGLALAGFALVGVNQGYGALYASALGVMAALLVYQQILIRERDQDRCFAAFRNNVWVGFALFAGMVLETGA